MSPAAKKTALLIGNDRYQGERLKPLVLAYPVPDAFASTPAASAASGEAP